MGLEREWKVNGTGMERDWEASEWHGIAMGLETEGEQGTCPPPSPPPIKLLATRRRIIANLDAGVEKGRRHHVAENLVKDGRHHALLVVRAVVLQRENDRVGRDHKAVVVNSLHQPGSHGEREENCVSKRAPPPFSSPSTHSCKEEDIEFGGKRVGSESDSS